MKTIPKYVLTITILLTILLTSQLQAQTFEIEDETVMYNETLKACIIVSVDPEEKTLKNAWQDYLKDNYDIKLRGRDVLSAEEINVQQITSNTINFYTIIEEDNNGSTMKVFATKGYDIVIT